MQIFIRYLVFAKFGKNPLLFSALAASLLAALGAGILLVYTNQHRQALEEELARLTRKIQAPPAVEPDAQIALTKFSSAKSTEQVNRLLQELGQPLQEISFSIEEAANRPYLRHRATLTLSADYPVIRTFIKQVNTRLDDAVVDAVSCTRESIDAPIVHCDLVISTFHQKASNG